jgi:hypothetical protein
MIAMKMPLRGLAAATLSCWIAAPSPVRAMPVISELFYDAVGTDDGLLFVELYGAPGHRPRRLRDPGHQRHRRNGDRHDRAVGRDPANGLFVVADGFATGRRRSPTPT